MRVLQVHCRYRIAGGEDAVVRAEARLLSDAGHQVESFVVENAGSWRAGVQLAAAPWNPRRAAQLRAVADRFRPHVVHVHNTWYGLSPAVAVAASDLGLPVVLTLHNYRLRCANGALLRDGVPCEKCVTGNAFAAVRHACYRGSRSQSAVAATTIGLHRRRRTWDRSVDRFISMSAFAADRAVAGGLPAARIAIRPHPVPDPGPRPAPPSSSDTVVFAGRLSAEKGLSVLLDAWRQPPPGLRLMVAGDGPERAALEATAPPGVDFVGRLPADRMQELLLSARGFAFPSTWYETQGLALTEALAAGLPVVASDLGVIPGIAGPGALLTPPSDVAAWRSSVGRLRDDTLVDAAGAASREHYETSFTEDAAAASLVAVYEQAARARAARVEAA